MKNILSVFSIVGMVLLLASCSPTEDASTEGTSTEGTSSKETTNETSNETTNETSKEASSDPINVAVSILPQEAIVEAIAGDLVTLTTVIPPGASPANYQPTPRQIQEFGDADVYFAIGVPTEAANIFPNMVDDREDLRIVHLDEIVAESYAPRYFSEDDEHGDEDHDDHDDEHADEDHDDHDDEHADEDHDDHDDEHVDEDHDDHDHSGQDPHIWMSPKRMMLMAEETYRVLAEMDPDNAATYKENLQVFLDELEVVNTSLETAISSLANKEFIIMHPSMGYFADDYGLEMVALEKDGKESTASHLQLIIDYALEHEIKVVFYQAEFDSSQAKTLAEEIDGEVLELEVLSKDYITNMKAIEQIFVDTLQ